MTDGSSILISWSVNFFSVFESVPIKCAKPVEGGDPLPVVNLRSLLLSSSFISLTISQKDLTRCWCYSLVISYSLSPTYLSLLVISMSVPNPEYRVLACHSSTSMRGYPQSAYSNSSAVIILSSYLLLGFDPISFSVFLVID